MKHTIEFIGGQTTASIALKSIRSFAQDRKTLGAVGWNSETVLDLTFDSEAAAVVAYRRLAVAHEEYLAWDIP